MHEAIFARQDGDESAKVHQSSNLAVVNTPDFNVSSDQFDATRCLPARFTINRRNTYRTVVVDIDRSTGLFSDRTNDRTALADNITDFLRINFHGDDGWSPLRHLATGLTDDLVHFIQDVQTCSTRLLQRGVHNFTCDALDLDIHLQSGNTVCRTGHLEIHVAKVVFVTQDIGQYCKIITFLNEAHCNTGNRRLQRHTGVHECEARAANRCHRAGTIGFSNFGYDADHVTKLVHVRHNRFNAAARQFTVTDFTALRRSDKACLAYAERREVVMQHERFFALAFDRINDLCVTTCAECCNDNCLRLSACENSRTVCTR